MTGDIDSATYFGIPDVRGRVIAGPNGIRGLPGGDGTTYIGILGMAIGDPIIGHQGRNGGDMYAYLNQAQLPNVTGQLNLHGGEGGSSFISGSGVFAGGDIRSGYKAPNGTNGGSQSYYYYIPFSLGGSGQGHNNVQPTKVDNFIMRIK